MNSDLQRELRDVFGTFVTGVTVVTTRDGKGQPHGVTANSFSSVSLDPPLVLWSQSLKALSYPAFQESDHFAVNILAEDQIDVSQRFARSGADKFGGLPMDTSENGVPLIRGCAAFIECRKIATYPGGDHAVFLGQVDRFRRMPARPLAFGGGRYMVAHPHDLGPGSDDPADGKLDLLRAQRLIHHALPDLANRLEGIVGLGLWANEGATVVRWEPGPNPAVRDLVSGHVVSPLGSATGLAFCAWLPRPRWQPLADRELARVGGSQQVNALSDERLDAIRKCGFARSTTRRGDLEVAALSAPVYDRAGRMVAALTLADQADRLPDDAAHARVRLLREEAAAISRRIGWQEADLVKGA
ncbi:MAG TPA: flavin reductase [Ramlibacter sp.]|nr:flavin reductase [Ramlibacter sp.]